MSKSRWIIYCALLGCIPMVLHGYIYDIKTLRRWDKTHERYHYFIGCSDFHDKTNPVNDIQRPSIEKTLTSLDSKKFKALVEDLGSPNEQGDFVTGGQFYIHAKGGVLAGLSNFCRTHRVPCENIEYRYCRVATMGPVINNVIMSPHAFPSTRSVKVGCMVDEIEDAINQIKNPVLAPQLKKAYIEEVKKIRIICDKLKLNAHRKVTVADYLQAATTQQNRLDVLKHLLTFDSGLLDIKMAAAVVNAQDKEKIIGFAGGTHITHVCDLLKKMGYQEYSSTQASYKKEHDLSKCLGSVIVDGAYCVKPEPLSIEIIKKYLTQ